MPAISVTVTALLLVLFPSSQLLSRRLLINGSVVIGWYGATWWMPDVFGTLGRVRLLVGIALGALVYFVVVDALRGKALVERYLPRPHWLDLMIPAGAAAAGWLSWPFVRGNDGVEQMSRLMLGWDQAGHFSMIYLQRLLGQLPPAESGFDGSLLFYAPYSQYMHSLMNGLTELRVGPEAREPIAEVVLYSNTYGALYVAVTALLVAGVVQVPGLRRHPLVAITLSVAAIALMTLGPGGSSLMRGHLNVGFAGVTIALMVLIIVPHPDPWHPVVLAPAAGLVVATTGAWPLIGPWAGLILAVALVRDPRTRFGFRRHWASTVAIGALLLACLVKIGLTITGYDVGSTLTLPGDAIDAQFSHTVGLLALAIFMAAYQPRVVAGWSYGVRHRYGVQSWSLVGLLAGLSVLAGYQLIADGQLSYYFWKLGIGVQIALVAFVALGAARLVRPPLMAASGAKRWSALALIGAMGFMITVYGGIANGFTSWFGDTSKAVALRSVINADTSFRIASHRIVLAYEVAKEYPKGSVTYYAIQPHDGYSVLDDHWMHAMLGDWSVKSDKASAVGIDIGGPDWWQGFSYEKVADRMIETFEIGGAEHVIVVAPEVLEAVLAELPDRYQGRVITW
ncbi:hypothetical protein [Blastococcus sp. Marseille-P5729]|uniref:hypothetical protein n=1 Tax=Blastococcus sp. Marseille-P5729 TaxID=2086582 RepID=UPI000D0E3B8F|nr:hypothetical protein [Blastococcus sp. Marseille-P5729]